MASDKDYNRSYYLKNKHRFNTVAIKERKRLWYLKNIDQCRKRMHTRYLAHKKEHCAANKKWREDNNEKFKKYMRDYYIINKKSLKLWAASYYLKNKEKIKERVKQWRNLNKNKDKANHKKYAIMHKKEININKLLWQKNTEKGRLLHNVTQQRRVRRMPNLDKTVVRQVYSENVKKFGRLTCELCFKPIKKGQDSLEHFYPVSRLKEYDKDINVRENLGVAHSQKSKERCNTKKNNKTRNEWFADFMEINHG